MHKCKEPIGRCEVCERTVCEKSESKMEYPYASVVCRLCEKKFPDLDIEINKKGDLLLTWTDEGIIHHKLIPRHRRNGIILEDIIQSLQ